MNEIVKKYIQDWNTADLSKAVNHVLSAYEHYEGQKASIGKAFVAIELNSKNSDFLKSVTLVTDFLEKLRIEIDNKEIDNEGIQKIKNSIGNEVKKVVNSFWYKEYAKSYIYSSRIENFNNLIDFSKKIS